MEIKDLAGLSQPLTKLIEVVSGGIGTIYKPRAIRKEAEAEAYKKELMANAEAKKILLEGEAKIELLERAKERLVYQELSRQVNIEEIAEKSIKYLDESVSEEPVDNDWRTRFFQKAQDITNEEMQEVWAKILANEVSKPGTVSYRTLEVISNLSKQEAELFQLACSFVSMGKLIWKVGKSNDLSNYGLTYEHLMLLRDAGLMHQNDNLHTNFKTVKIDNNPRLTIMNIGNGTYQVSNEKKPEATEFQFNQISLSIAGTELCRIIDTNKNEQYISDLIEDKEKQGYKFLKLVIKKNTTDNNV